MKIYVCFKYKTTINKSPTVRPIDRPFVRQEKEKFSFRSIRTNLFDVMSHAWLSADVQEPINAFERYLYNELLSSPAVFGPHFSS